MRHAWQLYQAKFEANDDNIAQLLVMINERVGGCFRGWLGIVKGLNVSHVSLFAVGVDSQVDIIIRAFAGQSALTVLRHFTGQRSQWDQSL